VVDEDGRSIYVLEYTRPSDTVLGALGAGAARKETKYQIIIDALAEYAQQGWTVTLFPLPVGERGTLREDHWGPALEALGVPTTLHSRLLNQVAAISIRATHLLHLCRHQRLRAPQHTRLQNRRREFAEMRWGEYPPDIGVAAA
jgi:hypothetical protein